MNLRRFPSNLGDVFFPFQTQKIPYFFGGLEETNGPTPPWDGWRNQDTYNIILMNKRPKFDIHLENFEGNIFPEVTHIPRCHETMSLSFFVKCTKKSDLNCQGMELEDQK